MEAFGPSVKEFSRGDATQAAQGVRVLTAGHWCRFKFVPASDLANIYFNFASTKHAIFDTLDALGGMDLAEALPRSRLATCQSEFLALQEKVVSRSRFEQFVAANDRLH